MTGVVERTLQMKDMTGAQAQRSDKLTEITEESASAAMQTMEGATAVVGITGELKKLSESLNRQVSQFKLGDDSRPTQS
jgi:methyl-accepting chemotaxis protein